MNCNVNTWDADILHIISTCSHTQRLRTNDLESGTVMGALYTMQNQEWCWMMSMSPRVRHSFWMLSTPSRLAAVSNLWPMGCMGHMRVAINAAQHKIANIFKTSWSFRRAFPPNYMSAELADCRWECQKTEHPWQNQTLIWLLQPMQLVKRMARHYRQTREAQHYEDSENGQEPWLPHSTQPVALDWIPSCGQEEG